MDKAKEYEVLTYFDHMEIVGRKLFSDKKEAEEYMYAQQEAYSYRPLYSVVMKRIRG
ncbi:hypothetical protein [Streptococcus danieliae]|uniref:Uncharacterized protein n=1 Tax=Streptococcus danieliae TaxID=747656 RepID=A0A7Z0M6I9_9STRE|nr:hypothetical protein [Streptococcus danieliae]MBF0699445.1 hypothetical protein [Streptococcus danieliae]NYS96621.1 hypothetical protein [Streptococcus danieliae]